MSFRSKITAMALSCAALVPTWTLAETPAKPEHLLALFGASCFTNLGVSERVQHWAKREQLEELSAESATKLLGGAPGRVWAIKNKYGDYLIVSAADDKCSVQTTTAAAPQMLAAYKDFIASLPGTLKPRVVLDTTQQESSGSKRTLKHELSDEPSPLVFEIQLTTLANSPEEATSSIWMHVHPK